jgi:hypothetical protein
MSSGKWTISTKLYNEYRTLLQQSNQIDVLAEETEHYMLILDHLWNGLRNSEGLEKDEQMAADIRNLIDKYGEYSHGLDKDVAKEYASWLVYEHPVFAEAAFEQALKLARTPDFRQLIEGEIPYYERLASGSIRNLREKLSKANKAWWMFWK